MLVVGVFGAACSHDWDAFDPRLGGGGSSDARAGASGAPSSDAPSSSGGSIGSSGAATGGGSGASFDGSPNDAASGGTAGGLADAAGDVGSVGGADAAAGRAGASGAAGAGDGAVTTAGYASSVSDCINPTTPNPDTCEMLTGTGQMSVDLLETQTNMPHYAFLRFNLDGAFAGRSVVSVRLRLHTSNDANAQSPSSGEVWQVSAFTRQDLFTSAPTRITRLAGDMGAVAASAPVVFSLPATSVTPSSSVYLGLFPVNNDGINYYNAKGSTPPRLEVDYR